jgi:hypothetical protein
LTAAAVVTGAGSQGAQTPNVNTQLDSSGNFTTPGTITAGANSSTAGTIVLNEGTAPTAAATNTVQIHAPVDVTTPYDLIIPAAPATGIKHWTNSAGVVTESISAVDLTSADVTGALVATKGGTGQSTYTKGDLLASPGSNSLNKLSVGTDGQVLTADAASTNGVKWSTVSGFDPVDLSTAYYRDEFGPGNNTSGTLGEHPWIADAISGSGITAQLDGSYPQIGIMEVTSGSSTNDVMTVHWGKVGVGASRPFGNLGGNTNWEFKYRFKIDSTSNVRHYIGVISSAANDAVPTDFIGIRANTGLADSSFTFVCTASSTTTASTTGSVSLDTSWHTLRVWSTSAGTINFSLDGGTTASISTNVPTAVMTPTVQAGTLTNADKKVDIDIFAAKFTGLSRN